MRARLAPSVGTAPLHDRRRSTTARRAAIVRDATAVIEAEFSRSLSTEDLARRVASSPRQLRRAFAEITGTTVRAFVTDVRMSNAKRLLATTDIPVKEVATRVGYRRASAFTKAFSRLHGESPSDFRRRTGL